MLTSKLDLYKGEWLELVFDDRNKAYGAYDLRKHYNGALLKAMAVTFSAVICLFVGYNVFHKNKPMETIYDIPIPPRAVSSDNRKTVVPPASPVVKQPKVNTVKFPPPVVRPDVEAQNPPTIDDAKKSVIGNENVKGNVDDGSIIIPDNGPGGTTMTKVTEEKPVETFAVEVQPQPVGGADGWLKFLQKNIHYPAQAVEAGVQGKVFLSFIVEKDGHLSNIVVERGLGSGIDEEAVRVLKLAPAWKPGIQNGRPVRVKFTLPITFQIPTKE